MSMNPPLDAARLNFVSATLDSAASLFKRTEEDERFDASRGKSGLPEGEADRLGIAAQCVRWLAEEFRRSGTKLIAMDEVGAARFSGEPAVPSTPAVFAASIRQPDPPPFPTEPIPVAAKDFRMELVRKRLEEACSLLANDQGRSTSAALENVQALHAWCSGSAPQEPRPN